MSGALGLESGVLSRRVMWILAGLVLGGLFVALTAAFLAFAAYLALLDHLAPWQAALSVACGALGVAVVALAVAMRSAGQTAHQVNVAVKSSALALIAPAAARLAIRNARLTASLAGLAAAVIALWRVKNRASRTDG
jgi:hypothetical protein